MYCFIYYANYCFELLYYIFQSERLEREKRLELSTSTLARLRSTN
jgi:hypothetical protein